MVSISIALAINKQASNSLGSFAQKNLVILILAIHLLPYFDVLNTHPHIGHIIPLSLPLSVSLSSPSVLCLIQS